MLRWRNNKGKRGLVELPSLKIKIDRDRLSKGREERERDGWSV
jgi:hypothetical protein